MDLHALVHRWKIELVHVVRLSALALLSILESLGSGWFFKVTNAGILYDVSYLLSHSASQAFTRCFSVDLISVGCMSIMYFTPSARQDSH